MPDTVIKVESLSKKYVIGHQRAERYQTFRDNLAAGAMDFVRRLRSPFTFNVSPLTETQEEFYALKDVSFEVKRGDRVGIIGRNGAGKSTLLKILSRITEPTSGRIEIDGRVASLLEVGTGFHPELTGRENIFLNGAILGMTREEIKRKFDEIVAFAEIEKFLDTPVKRYSSGMYVRLAFAVAAHLEPEILIVDEVLAVGDAQFQKKCLGKMEEVGREGRTVLFVSHQMAAVQRLCSSGVYLRDGEIVNIGNVDDIVSDYANSGDASSFCWELTAPSEKKVYIRRIDVCNLSGKTVNCIETSGKVILRAEFVMLKPCPNFQLCVQLLDEFSNYIFESTPQDVGVAPPTRPGHYIVEIQLPPDIFLVKPYRLKLSLWGTREGLFDAVDDIKFMPVETFSKQMNFPKNRKGMLAVRCEWAIRGGQGEQGGIAVRA